MATTMSYATRSFQNAVEKNKLLKRIISDFKPIESANLNVKPKCKKLGNKKTNWKIKIPSSQSSLNKSRSNAKAMKLKNNNLCSFKKSRKRPPRKCYKGRFENIYDMVHTNVVVVSTKGSTVDREKTDRYQKKKELKMVADAASERNLTGNDLIVITDYISVQSNLTNDFEDMLSICDKVVDNQNLNEMIKVSKVFNVGPRLLHDIEITTRNTFDSVIQQQDGVILKLQNIELKGEKIENKTYVLPTERSEDENVSYNQSDTINLIENNNKIEEDTILNTIVIRNIEKLMPLEFEGENEINVNKSFLNSDIVTGTLLTHGSKRIIHNNITVLIKLAKKVNISKDSVEIPVFWNATNSTHGFWSKQGCNKVSSTEHQISFTCNHLTSFSVMVTGELNNIDSPLHAEIISYITLVAMVVSIIAELASLIIMLFISYFDLTHLSTKRKLLAHLLTSLIIGQTIFIVAVETAHVTKALCAIVALFLSYTYTCSFFWMLNIAIHLIYSTSERLLGKKAPLWMFYLIGYLLPAFINVFGLFGTQGHGYGTDKHCWLSGKALWIFIIPVIFVIIFNMVVGSYVLWKLTQVTYVKLLNKANKIRKLIRAVLLLTPSLGLAWIFGLMITITPSNVVLHYVFAVTASLQGFWIFVTCILLDEKVRGNMYTRISRMSLSRTENYSLKNQKYRETKNDKD